jgi:hypothetical protein
MPLMLTGAGAAGALTWTPARVSGLTYFTPGPAWCFTDAGTTPAGVGDAVQTMTSRYGPAATLSQATAAKRPTLRQAAGGAYYLEFAAGDKFLSGTLALGTGDVAVTLASAHQCTDVSAQALPAAYGNSVAALATFGGYFGLRTANKISVEYGGGHPFDTDAAADLNADQSLVLRKAAGAINATTAVYRNGTAAAGAGTPSTSTPNVTATTIWLGSFGGSAADCFNGRVYGAGYAASALSAGDIAALDAFQRSLYA